MIKAKVIVIFIIACTVLAVSTSWCQTSDRVIKFGAINNPETKLYKQALAILTEALNRSGYGVSLEHLPGARSLKWANGGILDGDAFRVADLNKSGKYPNLIRVDEPILTIDQSVWSKMDIKVEGLESLKNYSVVYDRGTRFIEEKEKSFKSIYAVEGMEQVFLALNMGRADITITSRETGQMYLKKLNMEDSGIKVLSPPLEVIQLYPYMNRKHEQLVLLLARTLRSMKADGTYQKIVEAVQ